MQRIRLRADEIDDALDAARSLMRVTGASHASWWLSERSTPPELERLLLERGLQIVEGDYLIDGMLLTAPPPAAEGVVVRRVADADEHVAAVEVQYAAFGTPAERRRSREDLRDEHHLNVGGDVVRTYGAWVDGELVAAARGIFTPRGVLLSGGGTLPEARGRGAYRALVRARWDDAVACGTPALAVQAGAMSAPILRGLGFERVVAFRRLGDVLSGP